MILFVFSTQKTIPQSALLTAPFTQRGRKIWSIYYLKTQFSLGTQRGRTYGRSLYFLQFALDLQKFVSLHHVIYREIGLSANPFADKGCTLAIFLIFICQNFSLFTVFLSLLRNTFCVINNILQAKSFLDYRFLSRK